MTSRRLVASFCMTALAAGCAQTSTPTAKAVAVPEAAAARRGPQIPAVGLEGYKKEVAARIATRNRHMFSDPVPDMLKSIVVLDITIDRHGNLARVAVRRSNGFKNLEARAMESVREAAPYVAPNLLVRHDEGSVSFLETFLFREDGRFQIRSLVAG